MDKRKIEDVIAKAEELYAALHRSHLPKRQLPSVLRFLSYERLTALQDRQLLRLLRFLSYKRLSAFNDAHLYKLKGMALNRFGRLKRVKEAISAFTEAIQLQPSDPSLYRERAMAWNRMRDRKNALKDLDKAISLNPKDPDSYLARAEVWRTFREFKESKQDLGAAIRLSPKNPKAYYRRRALWMRLGNKTKEIKDLATALQLDPKAPPQRYVELGDLYYREKKYSLAFDQYNRAMDMDPRVNLWQVDYAQVTIFNALASLNDGQKRKIYEACIPISGLLHTVRYLTTPESDRLQHDRWADGLPSITKSYIGQVVHFTKLPVADILVSSDENKFRFYHVSYMNDPEEGKILLQILNDPEIEESYNAGSRNEESNFYLGSFLPATLADELVMWRTYGKDETDSEGKGCSIIIGREFFDEEEREESQTRQDEQDDLKSRKTRGDKEPRSQYDTQLHKVIYYNRNEHKILGSDGAEIMKELRKLQVRLRQIIDRFKDSDEKHSAINRAVDSIVYSIITELRYYFKSSDYSYENEERVILFVPPKSPLVKIEEGTALPKRLYVEAKTPIRKHIKKIVLGPRVIHPERWSYLKVKMIKDNNDLELVKSSTKFQ